MHQNESQEKYQLFLEWFTSNGGKYSHIKYPSYFPPTNYIGLAASQNIPRNTAIMSVPKNLIISIDLVRKSEIGFLMGQYPCFNGEDNDDKDFNMLTLYLIMEKMKGKDSFFSPYLECITVAETMVHWSNQEITALEEPFLNLSFLEEVKKQFEPTFKIFKEIISKNRNIFVQELTQPLFYQCYGMTMTRCFGWGLPQTMLVPFADFMNHHSEGVHHYAFSQALQNQQHSDYIKKSQTIDLRVMGIDNSKKIPIGYEKDSRQLFLENNQELLQTLDLPLKKDVQKISHSDFLIRLNALRTVKSIQNYKNDLYPSSESEDNDTNSQSSDDDQESWNIEAIRFLRMRKFFNQLNEVIKKQKQEEFYQPKPEINKEFQQGVEFKWWYQQDDSCFLVSTSRAVDEGEQIYNSYGRRNNRFLLLWYGFTFENNKYDSVPFRLWQQKIEKSTGQFVFTRYITDTDWKQQIPIGNQRYPYTYLSSQFRLKKTEINYYLLAYLRFRIIRNIQKFANLRSRYNELHKILDLEVQAKAIEMYQRVLMEIIKHYGLDREKDFSCMKEERKVYSIILTQSNAEIVQRHCKGLEVTQRLVKEIKKSPLKKPLNMMYEQEWPEEIAQNGKERVLNRMFLRHYFKLLEGYLSYH